MTKPSPSPSTRAERRAAPKPARIPSGDRPTVPSDEGQTLQCARCLYTSAHPLGLTLDDEGICSGCRIHEEKDRLDWAARWRELEQLVAPYRSKSGTAYDCIVPVSGAGDSYWIVHLVKHKLGLNPLLVSYNKLYNSALGIRNLANLRIKMDCDILMQNVNPHAVKRITRTTLRELGSLYWHCIAGQTVFPVQTAVRYRVPLIIWGAHQGLEQVGMYSHEHTVEMSRRYRKDHDLMGLEADDLLGSFDTLREEDIWQYRYPDDAALHAVGVRGIYLGNYVRWDPLAQHRQMVEQFGYLGARFARSFDTYDHADCWNYLDLHDAIKQRKHGYGKVTDQACREIRHGRLTREQAQALVQHHESQPVQHDDKFCAWLGLDASGLRFLLDRVGHDDAAHRRAGAPAGAAWTAADTPIGAHFIAGSVLAHDGEDGYVTVGKGHP